MLQEASTTALWNVPSLRSGRALRGRFAAPQDEGHGFGVRFSGGGDIFPQRLALAVDHVDVALDDVADRNDADQPSVLDHGDMAESAFGHRLHDMVDRVVA